MTRYISTRNTADVLSGHEAVIAGLAKDGGLYTPESIDVTIRPEEILNDSYQECAVKIIHALLDDYTEEEIRECAIGAYDEKFDTDAIVPLRGIRSGWLMELWHGPTSAFKDIALTILPRLLTCAYQKENRNDIVSILTATSGDTGKAALSGFADVPHTAITVFYPEIGVSPIQKKQMATSKGDNVEVIAVKGNFDDCQRMVKEAVSSKEVLDACKGVTISSANSINVGRLVPQIVYYYYSYGELVSHDIIRCGEPVNFIVPTGNFGDILAGYLAKRIGLPINKLICASNSNNVLTDFLETGHYSLDREFITTMSPSMDILISSNLERLLFMLSGNNDVKISAMMDSLKQKGSYRIDDVMLQKLKETFKGYWTSEEQCAATIHDLFVEQNTLIDPHTAVGVSAMERYQKETGDFTPAIVLSTASPYKFCKDVYFSITGERLDDDFEAMDALEKLSGVKVPANLAELKNLEVRFTRSIEKEDGLHAIAERMKGLSDAQN